MPASPRLRRIHRWLGAALVLPLLLWTATGLLFLVKPGWRGAYEMLDPFRAQPIDPHGLVPLAGIVAGPGASRVELGNCVLGDVYVITLGTSSFLADARSGDLLSPLDDVRAERVAVDAASRARVPERFGEVTARESSADSLKIRFAGGATVTVGRRDLALYQSGPDTDRIDLLYRIHYLQWTGSPSIDRPFAIAAIVATWGLALLGVLLWRKRA